MGLHQPVLTPGLHRSNDDDTATTERHHKQGAVARQITPTTSLAPVRGQSSWQSALLFRFIASGLIARRAHVQWAGTGVCSSNQLCARGTLAAAPSDTVRRRAGRGRILGMHAVTDAGVQGDLRQWHVTGTRKGLVVRDLT